jgi:predicted TPR repeat methyltransferase
MTAVDNQAPVLPAMAAHAQDQATEDRETVSELALPEALALAIHAHRTGHLDDAEALYGRILEVAPDHPDAAHFLGVLLHRRGRGDAALELIERSIALDPTLPGRYNNLGNVLLELGRLAEATDAYQRAIDLLPGHADAYSNLGAVLNAQGRLEEAHAAYRKAIELDPDHADAYNNLGNLLRRQGRIHEAVTHYCKALTLRPNCVESKKLLGVAYYSIGEVDAAAGVFRSWLDDEPANPVAHHLLAACSGQDVPARASDAYIETTFDSFAASFDARLEHLGYRAPGLIAEALAKVVGQPCKDLVVLDAGCGTGLCGPLISPYVGELIGVDLSSAMLAQAQGRGVYDRLVKAELTAFLEAQPGAFDAVVSADTLVYFGSLTAVLQAAFCALRPDGLIVFTVEETFGDAGADGYRINPHGRYSHSRGYVHGALRGAGFTVLSIEPAVLRTESGAPVAGLVVTGRKGSGSSQGGATGAS